MDDILLAVTEPLASRLSRALDLLGYRPCGLPAAALADPELRPRAGQRVLVELGHPVATDLLRHGGAVVIGLYAADQAELALQYIRRGFFDCIAQDAGSEVLGQVLHRAVEAQGPVTASLAQLGRAALNLAHELNNPLCAASLQLQLLGADLPAAERQALAGRLQMLGDNLERIRRQIAEFSRTKRELGFVTGGHPAPVLARQD